MRTERGNILFLILLAVVLFAALSYAVTSSMRGGGNDGSKESNEAAAADIMGWLSLVDNGLSRMRLSGGYRPEQISYTLPVKLFGGTTGNITHNTACSTNACQLFNAAGGGVTPRGFEKYAVAEADITGFTPTAGAPGSGAVNFSPMVWPGAGTSANDLVLMIGYIKPEICDIIATRTGTITTWTRSGAFANGGDPANWDTSGVYAPTDNTAMFTGRRIIAYKNSSYNFCVIYQLLVER